MGKSISMILLAMLLPTGVSASPLWTEEAIRAECRKTSKTNIVDLVESCVTTTKQEFTTPVEEALRRYDPTKQPVLDIIDECARQNSDTVRLLAGCLESNLNPVRRFLKEGPSGFDWGDGQKRGLSTSEQNEIKSALASQLKDPESARFSLGQYNGSAVYCGLVNARNSYGGYTGFQPFIIAVERDGQIFKAGIRFDLGEDAERACKSFRY